MEKDFVDLVYHVFTLQWATWALPVSMLLSLLVKRMIPVLIVSILAVGIHHAGPVLLPALLGGENVTTLASDISALIPKLEPISILAEYISYAFLIKVFSLTWRDMFRPSVSD